MGECLGNIRLTYETQKHAHMVDAHAFLLEWTYGIQIIFLLEHSSYLNGLTDLKLRFLYKANGLTAQAHGSSMQRTSSYLSGSGFA